MSCEPCRRRKIKCSRTRPPCDTCRRRGCGDSCVYKGSREDSSTASHAAGNEELLNRICNLENLLRQQTGAQIPRVNGGLETSIPSPPTDSVQSFRLSPESSTSENQTYLSDSPGLSSHGVGVLTSTPNGNVRYEPRSSQWASVLANTSLSTRTPSLEVEDNARDLYGFPFTTSAIPTIDDLLSLLPPMQQCDYLKNTYFTVFSPVSIPL